MLFAFHLTLVLFSSCKKAAIMTDSPRPLTSHVHPSNRPSNSSFIDWSNCSRETTNNVASISSFRCDKIVSELDVRSHLFCAKQTTSTQVVQSLVTGYWGHEYRRVVALLGSFGGAALQERPRL